ncbi:MAG: hypothetical protein IJJ74_08330 [Eubacterium sp.]|nr:hypothetical protein [Eubacterium sp.]
MKFTDVSAVSNLEASGGKTTITDCSIGTLQVNGDAVVNVDGDTKVETVHL